MMINNMYEELDCTKEQYNQLVKKIGVEPIYSFVNKYGGRLVGLLNYIDNRGRFKPIKFKQDLIADIIFEALNSTEKIIVLQYIEDYEDGKL